MKWIAENYQLLLVAVGAILNILNAATKSYQHRKPGFAKFLMWLLEKVTVMQSKDAPGWFKLPLRTVAPEPSLPPKVEEVHTPVKPDLVVGDKQP